MRYRRKNEKVVTAEQKERLAALYRDRGTCSFDEPLAAHTTFRIGGSADVYLVPADEEQLAELKHEVMDDEWPMFEKLLEVGPPGWWMRWRCQLVADAFRKTRPVVDKKRTICP